MGILNYQVGKRFDSSKNHPSGILGVDSNLHISGNLRTENNAYINNLH